MVTVVCLPQYSHLGHAAQHQSDGSSIEWAFGNFVCALLLTSRSPDVLSGRTALSRFARHNCSSANKRVTKGILQCHKGHQRPCRGTAAPPDLEKVGKVGLYCQYLYCQYVPAHALCDCLTTPSSMCRQQQPGGKVARSTFRAHKHSYCCHFGQLGQSLLIKTVGQAV